MKRGKGQWRSQKELRKEKTRATLRGKERSRKASRKRGALEGYRKLKGYTDTTPRCRLPLKRRTFTNRQHYNHGIMGNERFFCLDTFSGTVSGIERSSGITLGPIRGPERESGTIITTWPEGGRANRSKRSRPRRAIGRLSRVRR